MKVLSYIETPFPEKFGVPRQSLLVEAQGIIRFPKDDFYTEAFRGIEGFSHLWLIFDFHLVGEGFQGALVRPPRFDGKKKLGVFATRTPHRPNRIGLSVVKFEKLEITSGEVILQVSGVDLVDKTPIYDIKPYIPYADSHPEAKALDYHEAPEKLSVRWIKSPDNLSLHEKNLIEQVIGLDPRPGQDKVSDAEYGVSLLGWNFRFKKELDIFLITDFVKE